MSKKISPFHDAPLNQAGDSLVTRKNSIIVDTILMPTITIFGMGILAMSEWLKVVFKSPPQPVFITALFGCVLAVSIVRIIRGCRTLSNCNLGITGERLVAERLNELRADGYCVIHDVPLAKMNIDHVLVGSGGIFVIETKAARKTVGQKSLVTHTKNGIFINGKKGWMGKAIWEAKKGAEYLKSILSSDKSQGPHIQPVVVYPGWYVKDDGTGDVWVLNDRYLVEKIRRLPPLFSREAIANIRQKIESYERRETKR